MYLTQEPKAPVVRDSCVMPPVNEEINACHINLKDVMIRSIIISFRNSKLITQSRIVLSNGVATSYCGYYSHLNVKSLKLTKVTTLKW